MAHAFPGDEFRPRAAPGHLEARLGLADAHDARGHRDLAIAVALECAERAPELSGVHYNLGCHLLGANRFGEAKDAFARAVALAPDYARAHGNRGVACHRMGELDAALESYETAHRLDPENLPTVTMRSS